MGGKNGLFKVKNRLVIKNQEVRGQVSTTFSEAPNSELTVSKNIFVVARLKSDSHPLKKIVLFASLKAL